MTLLVSIFCLVMLPVANLVAMAIASLGVARAFGVRGGALPFRHPPRERYQAASRWAFGATIVAGPAASYLCAAALFLVSALVGGRAEFDTRVTVIPGGRAEAAGLRTGDRIVSVAGQHVERFDEIRPALAGHAGQNVALSIERGGETRSIDVVTDGNAKIQVAAGAPRIAPVSLGEAVPAALAQPPRVIARIVETLFGRERYEVGGAVELVSATSRASEDARGSLLGLLGALNAYCWPLSIVVAFATRPRSSSARPSPKT